MASPRARDRYGAEALPSAAEQARRIRDRALSAVDDYYATSPTVAADVDTSAFRKTVRARGAIALRADDCYVAHQLRGMVTRLGANQGTSDKLLRDVAFLAPVQHDGTIPNVEDEPPASDAHLSMDHEQLQIGVDDVLMYMDRLRTRLSDLSNTLVSQVNKHRVATGLYVTKLEEKLDAMKKEVERSKNEFDSAAAALREAHQLAQSHRLESLQVRWSAMKRDAGQGALSWATSVVHMSVWVPHFGVRAHSPRVRIMHWVAFPPS